MVDRINGERVTVRREFTLAARASINAGAALRISDLEAKLAQERARRVKAEQQLAGLRSACAKLKALLLKERADKALQASRTFDVETAE